MDHDTIGEFEYLRDENNELITRNDAAEPEYLEEYETNMSNFINDIRADLEVPDMKFVIGLAGQGGFEDSYDLWVQDFQFIINK